MIVSSQFLADMLSKSGNISHRLNYPGLAGPVREFNINVRPRKTTKIFDEMSSDCRGLTPKSVFFSSNFLKISMTLQIGIATDSSN